MLRFGVTIILSAFLLFQVQPLIGKYILPWFGGGPAVWTACLLFFQLVLLVGYAYAHWACSRLPARLGSSIHLALLAVSLLVLPITPSPLWKPSAGDPPTTQILFLLAATVGLPYLLLSSTAPLVQRWFSESLPGRSPYRLYALSNAGSLLALLSYPFLFEPWLALRNQVLIWSRRLRSLRDPIGLVGPFARVSWASPRVLRPTPPMPRMEPSGLRRPAGKRF